MSRKSDTGILYLRQLTKKLRLVPGAVLVLDKIRSLFYKETRSIQVVDFDGNVKINLCLGEHMQSQIFWYGAYNRDILSVLRNLVKPGMVVIDAGANIGEITLLAAKKVGASGKVYSFEPLPEVSAKLEKNVRDNDFSQVSIQRFGLSDKAGEINIYQSSSSYGDGSDNGGLGTLYPSDSIAKPAGVIKLTTLDDFCGERKLQKVDLIKLDIEGAELPALKGALNTLKQFKPKLIIEVQEETAERAGYSADDILIFLANLGYEFQVIGRNGNLIDIDNKKSLKQFQNVLCSFSE